MYVRIWQFLWHKVLLGTGSFFLPFILKGLHKITPSFLKGWKIFWRECEGPDPKTRVIALQFYDFLVGCLNPCLQGTNIQVVSPQPWRGTFLFFYSSSFIHGGWVYIDVTNPHALKEGLKYVHKLLGGSTEDSQPIGHVEQWITTFYRDSSRSVTLLSKYVMVCS